MAVQGRTEGRFRITLGVEQAAGFDVVAKSDMRLVLPEVEISSLLIAPVPTHRLRYLGRGLSSKTGTGLAKSFVVIFAPASPLIKPLGLQRPIQCRR